MFRITDYEIINHGITSAYYFRGCGAAYSSYSEVVTGIGNDSQEALEDCLEQIAQSGDYDLSMLEKEVCSMPTESDRNPDKYEYCHVSVRWNEQ